MVCLISAPARSIQIQGDAPCAKRLMDCVTLYRHEICLLALALLLVCWCLSRRSSRREPPGPWGLPLLGYLPFLGRKMNLTLLRLSQKYGDVFQLRVGSRQVVVISGQRCVREALLERGLVFAGRPNFYSYSVVSKFGFSDLSPSFRLYKKQTMRAFGEFSSSRRSELESVAHKAVSHLLERFREARNEPYDPKPALDRGVCSIMGYLCYGEFFDSRDEMVSQLLERAQDFATFIAFGLVCDFMPWSRFLIRHKLRRLEELLEVFNRYSDKLASRYMQGYDRDNVRNMCDMFRRVSEDMSPRERELLRVDETMLKQHLSSIFGGGFGTTAGTLRYAILVMALYPDIQRRVQEEIDSLVPSDRFPSCEDQKRLVYTAATLTELYRHHSMAALSVTHATTCDTEFEGFFIQKDTPVIFSLYSAHRDETVFRDPHLFQPDRFIRADGTLDSALSQFVSPYGLGFRRCAGEPVARLEVTLFFSTILQQCRIERAEGHKLDLDNYVMTFGISHKPFKVIFRSRQGKW